MRSRAYLWKDHLADIEGCVDCYMVRGLTPVVKLMAGSGEETIRNTGQQNEKKNLLPTKLDRFGGFQERRIWI